MHMRLGRRSYFLYVLLILVVSLPAFSKSLYKKPRYERIHIRLIAREPQLPIVGFGVNVDSYVIELTGKDRKTRVARLSLRFLQYQNQIPHSFLDYAQVHTFVARRDFECDVRMVALIESGLQYSVGAPKLTPEGEATLPCFVTTPADYRGTRYVRREESEP